MRIVLLGAPGCGKDTQAELIAKHYRIVHISTTDLLREAAAKPAASPVKLTLTAKKAARAGRAPAEFVLPVLEARLRARDCKRGFILHDFPRDIPESQSLDTALGIAGKPLQIAIHLKAAEEVLFKRLTGRMQCTNKNCAVQYNRHFAPPAKRNQCDACGGKVLAVRASRPPVVTARIRAYHPVGDTLLAYYKAQHKLRTVAADGDDRQMLAKICELIDLELRPLEMTAAEAADGSNAGGAARLKKPSRRKASRAKK